MKNREIEEKTSQTRLWISCKSQNLRTFRRKKDLWSALSRKRDCSDCLLPVKPASQSADFPNLQQDEGYLARAISAFCHSAGSESVKDCLKDLQLCSDLVSSDLSKKKFTALAFRSGFFERLLSLFRLFLPSKAKDYDAD